jgi:hypothetical protein
VVNDISINLVYSINHGDLSILNNVPVDFHIIINIFSLKNNQQQSDISNNFFSKISTYLNTNTHLSGNCIGDTPLRVFLLGKERTIASKGSIYLNKDLCSYETITFLHSTLELTTEEIDKKIFEGWCIDSVEALKLGIATNIKVASPKPLFSA